MLFMRIPLKQTGASPTITTGMLTLTLSRASQIEFQDIDDEMALLFNQVGWLKAVVVAVLWIVFC